MAEVAVKLIVDELICFVVKEAKLLKGGHKDVQFIKDEMESIGVLLRDADGRSEKEEDVKIWVKQLRQVAFKMEDVLDEFRLRVGEQSHPRGALGWASKTLARVKTSKPRHVLATEIQVIKTDLVEISQRKERYKFKRYSDPNADSTGTWNYRRQDALFVEESELVGFEKPRDALLNWLVQGEEKRSVFAVVGTGGVGKTTIARKAYESDTVAKHFQCQAWIVVGQVYRVEDLLVRLIKELYTSRKEPIPDGIHVMAYDQLTSELRSYLQDKRYVVILDDIWDIELWDTLKNALLDNHCASRILVTSRRDDVACSFTEAKTHIYYLNPLPLQDALPLFYKKAFQSNSGGHCPPELKDFSKKIVERSGYLPLAIVTIGGLLSKKDKTLLEWEKFYDSLSSNLNEDPNLVNVMKIISLSYNDLPYYLKPCFLYFGIFTPEQQPIRSVVLVFMWIAEGFVKPKGGKALEEVGEDYLDQLASRSLVQIDNIQYREFRVHDLMREFILSRFVEEDFCQVGDGKSIGSSSGTPRRLSVQYTTEKLVMSSSLTRSLFAISNKCPKSLACSLVSNCGLLKLLNLRGAALDEFPHEITNLFHLRYLNLIDTRIDKLPATLGKLQNLETLLLLNTLITELPRAILKLQKLQHLLVYGRMTKGNGVIVPDGFGCLTALKSLRTIKIDQGIRVIESLGKLTQLRQLMVEGLRKVNVLEFCNSIAKMKFLDCLAVASSSGEDTVIEMDSLSRPPPLLKQLYLDGLLEKLPAWITSFMTMLRHLYLLNSRLREDPMEVLESLPNLEVFELYDNAYEGEELHAHAEGFQKLRKLTLLRLHNLQSVIIDKGTMPILQEMQIGDCTQLKEVPLGITHLTNLRSAYFRRMSDNFRRRLADEGADGWKVQHIPKVIYE